MAVGDKLTAFLFSFMSKASKIVSSAILSKDFETVVVNGKAYVIFPPTIRKIAGASYCLSDIGEAHTLSDIVLAIKDIEVAAKALSWLVKGDESLKDELSDGTLDEVVNALSVGFSLISAENFCKLSVLAKNVALLTAKTKQ